MRILRTALASVGILALCPVASHADGIDLVPYLTRVGYHKSLLITVVLVILFMFLNYVWNFLVIGLPAKHFGGVTRQSILRDLVVLTLGGQFADRVGAYFAGMASDPIANLLNLQGEAAWVGPLLILNFLFSGFAIALLVFFFCRWRWHLSVKATLIVMVLAAVFTNPAYALVLGGVLFRGMG